MLLLVFPTLSPNGTTEVKQHAGEDSFLASRTHALSDLTCNRNSLKTWKHLPKGLFLIYILARKKFSPAGWLQYFSSTWEQIDLWVLQVINCKGYQIEFIKTSVKTSLLTAPILPQYRTSILEKEVWKLLDKHAIHLANPPSGGSSLFVVPKKDGGSHSAVNLKPLKQFLVYNHFKIEGIHVLKNLLKEENWLVKIDLKDAYLTVPIWKGTRNTIVLSGRGAW